MRVGSLCALVSLAVVASAQPPPINRDQPHPHWEIEINETPNSATYEIVTGLEFTDVGGWKGFYADGLICLKWTGGPLPPGDSRVVIWPQEKPDARLDHWSNPSIPPEQSHVPPHAADACRWFASWSQTPADVPTLECTFVVKIRQLHRGGGQTDYSRTVRLRIAGGPLDIEKFQDAEPGVSFFKHRREDLAATPETVNTAFPWYCMDFDYNPFDYRTAGGYKPYGLQRVNVFKAKPLWQQPSDISVQYMLDGVGTFLNPNTQLDVKPNNQPDAQKTKFLVPSVSALVAMNGELNSTDPFTLSAKFYDGFPTGPPYPNPVATDQSGLFYELQDALDNKAWRKGADYAKFTPHRPVPTVVDVSHLLTTFTPPEGKVGRAFLYLLRDSHTQGMPGVWVQERFIGDLEGFGSGVPADFATNLDTGIKWVTQRFGYQNLQQFIAAATEDGVFSEADVMFYYPQNPPLTLLHEFWAATDLAAETLASYPWRVVPNTNPVAKRYLGVFVGSFDMVFDRFTVTHNPGLRHSGDGPPP